MALHRLTTAIAAGVLMLGLADCGGDPKPTASSGTPSPTVSASPTGPVAPVLPDMAKRHDEVGAKAFVKYWFEAVTYAMQTGDTHPFMAVSADECKTCRDLAQKVKTIYGRGGHIEGGGWFVSGGEVDPRLQPPLFRIAMKVEQPPQIVRAKDGHVVRRDSRVKGLFFAGARWSGKFEFLGLERIDD